MKFNGKDLSAYNTEVKQWKIDRGTRSLKDDSAWERGSALPIFQTPTYTFKDLTVTLMVYGPSREEIEYQISDILADLMDVTEIEMDGWEHQFTGVLQKTSIKTVSTTSVNRFQKIELTFSGYEHGEEVTVSGSGSTLTVSNPGNVISPAVVELTPSIGQASVTISGICRDSQNGDDLPVTVSATTTGKVIRLDGLTGLITEDGALKAGDVDMWALPTLLPGSNTITLDTSWMTTKVTVLPIYM